MFQLFPHTHQLRLAGDAHPVRVRRVLLGRMARQNRDAVNACHHARLEPGQQRFYRLPFAARVDHPRFLAFVPVARTYYFVAEANGQREDIVLYKGKILDGRNRLMACLREGVTPDFRDYQEQVTLRNQSDAALKVVLFDREVTVPEQGESVVAHQPLDRKV